MSIKSRKPILSTSRTNARLERKLGNLARKDFSMTDNSIEEDGYFTLKKWMICLNKDPTITKRAVSVFSNRLGTDLRSRSLCSLASPGYP
jgi:hypothetical protein